MQNVKCFGSKMLSDISFVCKIPSLTIILVNDWVRMGFGCKMQSISRILVLYCEFDVVLVVLDVVMCGYVSH